MSAFYARPHLRWQQTPDGQLLTVDGKTLPVIGSDGQPAIRAYTVAIGSGDQSTRLSSGLVIPWPKFKTRKAATAFCGEFAAHSYVLSTEARP